MSASKNRAISLQQSERKTLLSFLLLYSLMALIILLFSAFIYYNLQKEVMLSQQNSRLKEYSDKLLSKLAYMHENFYAGMRYPRSSSYQSAIYDGSNKCIFSTLENSSVDLNKNIYVVGDKIHYVRLLERYYLGAMYLVIEIHDNSGWFNFVRTKVIVYGLLLFLVLLLGGYVLLKLLLKPMRDSLYLLDRFIKDTTHELNTPINAILMNIETLSTETLDPRSQKKINRIDIAARTISNIYNDLTYMVLKHRTPSHNESIDMADLIRERVDFFKLIARQKQVKCTLHLKEGVFLVIDKNKISRIVDNLLSNAIKYNKRDGKIVIRLEDGYFEIADSGIGMRKEEVKNIFMRYSRFNQSAGGFGLGLNIVWEIVQEYHLKIDVDSKVGEGTKVRVTWGE